MAESSFDRLKNKISNNKIVTVILLACTVLGGLVAALDNFKKVEDFINAVFLRSNYYYNSRKKIEQAKKDSVKNAKELIAAVKRDLGVNTIYLDTLYSVDLDNNKLKDEFIVEYHLNKVDSLLEQSNYISIYKKTEDGLSVILQKKQEYNGEYFIDKFGNKNYLMERDVQGSGAYLNFQIYGYDGLNPMQLKLDGGNYDGFNGSMDKINEIYYLELAGKKYYIKYKNDSFVLIPDNHKLDVGGNVLRLESHIINIDSVDNYNFYYQERKLKVDKVKDSDEDDIVYLIKDTINMEIHESLYFDTNCESCVIRRFIYDDCFNEGNSENINMLTAIKKGIFKLSFVIGYDPKVTMIVKIE